jgi:hypothetical protein
MISIFTINSKRRLSTLSKRWNRVWKVALRIDALFASMGLRNRTLLKSLPAHTTITSIA